MDSRDGYVLKILYVKTKESGPLEGRAPGTPPSRSANGYTSFMAAIVYKLIEFIAMQMHS